MKTAPTTQTAQSRTASGHKFRPWYRWLLTALAFPPAGYVAHLIAGPVDSVPAAILNGLIAGAGIGAAQWALLRHRGVAVTWIPATAVGLGAGLTVGAGLVSYRTDITSLVVMGAASGLAVGVAQGTSLGGLRDSLDDAGRTLGWAAFTAAVWAVGWAVTTAIGIDVSQQWAVFGAAGCLTLAFLQSFVIDRLVPATSTEVTA